MVNIMELKEIQERFYKQDVTTEGIRTMDRVRHEMYCMAEYIDDALEDCREKSIALTKLEEAMFWVNKGFARACEVKEE